MVLYWALALVLHAASSAKAHGWSLIKLAPSTWRGSQHGAQEWIYRRGGAVFGEKLGLQNDAMEETEEEEVEVEEDDDGDEEIGLYVLVVDPMDCNGREFCKKIQEWGVTPIPVLSPAVAAAVAAADASEDSEDSDDSGGGLGHLAAPQRGQEIAWAAARGLGVKTNPPLAVLSESDAGIETALQLELALGASFGNAHSRPPPPLTDDATEVEPLTTPTELPYSPEGPIATGVGNVALRWKHATVAAVARAGLRAPRQALVKSWPEARAFLSSKEGLNLPDRAPLSSPLTLSPLSSAHESPPGSPSEPPQPLRAVLKPTRGAASMDVFAVIDLASAEGAFHAVISADSHGDGGPTNDVEKLEESSSSSSGSSSSSSSNGSSSSSSGSNPDDHQQNGAVLVQEYLSGVEFAVDTVSLRGEHKVCAVWRYDKRAVNGQAAPVVYFATMLQALPPLVERRDKGDKGEMVSAKTVTADNNSHQKEENEALRVAEYACACLNAVGFRDGPAHIEVKWPRQEADASTYDDSNGAATSPEKNALRALEESGPAIVEINARWHAANTAPLVEACLGGQAGQAASAIDATVFAVLASAAPSATSSGGDAATNAAGLTASQADSLNPRIQDASLLGAAEVCWRAIPPWYGPLRNHGRIVHLVSFVSGELRRVAHLDVIQALPSVEAIELSVGEGSAIQPTIDISATDCGQIRLVHKDPAVVERDFQTIAGLMPTMFEVRVPE